MAGPARRTLSDGLRQTADAARPRLRGWLHAGAAPVALAAGIALVVASPDGRARLAAVIYAATSVLLFAVSACYHRGRWTDRAALLLKRLDHANIFLIIAGTYTPFAMLALHGSTRVAVLVGVWVGAAVGVVFRVVWVQAPRWLYTPLYIALGWVAVLVLPQLLSGAGLAAFVLVLVGGGLYTLGGLVYALRRPDPSPRWFGFHEVFHALTLSAYAVQYAAVLLVTARIAA